jgi:predicted DNA-binding WGR domain protein
MTITLYQIDPARNRQRFYTLQLAPNLFGAWSLIRTWGRIGAAGQQRIDWHDTKEAAEQARDRLLQAKQRRGYHLRSGPA